MRARDPGEPSAHARDGAPPGPNPPPDGHPHEMRSVEVWVYEGGVMGLRGTTTLPPGGYDALLVVGGPRKSGARAVISEATVEPLDRYVERAKEAYVAQILAACGGNRTKAAKLLGVDVRTVFRLLAKMDRSEEQEPEPEPEPEDEAPREERG